jgi:hypothetical protein
MAIRMTSMDDDGSGDSRSDTVLTAVAPMESERQTEAIDDLRRLIEANRRLQTTLVRSAELYEASLARLVDGDDPGNAIGCIDVAGARAELADILAEYERARHHARGTFITAQFEGGMNMKEIGRVWGISRQLAHRFFKESRRDG